MKILLLGEYSNLHWLLAKGLEALGHDVTVASDGDGFKNYPRNINLERKSSSLKDTGSTLMSVLKNLKNFKGYDVVQLINPCFTQLNVSVNKYLFQFLKRNNKTLFLGAFGDDSFWLRACLNNTTFKYSEFFVDGKVNHLADNNRLKSIWLNTKRDSLNTEIAESCDGIIACLYEYYAAYKPYYDEKLTYIPLPINVTDTKKQNILEDKSKINFFIGINKARSEFKGTDRLYNCLQEIHTKYPEKTTISVAESVQYSDYMKMMSKADIVLDQLYSYSPAMNGLLALSMGKILVGGGEPEMYDMLNERDNRPIINVEPSEHDICEKLETLINNKDNFESISENSRLFVEKHHDHIKVAEQYLQFWKNKGA